MTTAPLNKLQREFAGSEYNLTGKHWFPIMAVTEECSNFPVVEKHINYTTALEQISRNLPWLKSLNMTLGPNPGVKNMGKDPQRYITFAKLKNYAQIENIMYGSFWIHTQNNHHWAQHVSII